MRSIQLFASLLFFAITTCVLVLPTGIAFAQVDRAGLVGTITDPSGKVVPGVHVVAEMPDMSLRRETVSSPTGSYDIPECRWVLIPSPSIIPASKALTFVEVKQVIGQTRTLDATLQVAGGEERVEVAPSSEQIDNSTDALGGRIEKVQADTLPVNGSNWATLTALVPGAVDTGGSNQRSIRFAGRGRDDDNFTYDGIDATNIINQPQQPMCGSRFRWTLSRSFGLIRCCLPQKPAQREDRSWPLHLHRARAGGTGTRSSFCVTMSLTRSSLCRSRRRRSRLFT